MRLVEELAGVEHRHALHRVHSQCAAAAADLHLLWRGAEAAAWAEAGHQLSVDMFLPFQPRPHDARRRFSATAPGWGLPAWSLAIVGADCLRAGRAARQAATGQTFPVFWTSIALIVVCRSLAWSLAGLPVTFDYPVLGGFNFSGGIVVIPEFMALFLALSIYTGTFIAEIGARRHPGGQPRPDRSGPRAGAAAAA